RTAPDAGRGVELLLRLVTDERGDTPGHAARDLAYRVIRPAFEDRHADFALLFLGEFRVGVVRVLRPLQLLRVRDEVTLLAIASGRARCGRQGDRAVVRFVDPPGVRLFTPIRHSRDVQPLRLVLLRRGGDRPVHLRGGRVQHVSEGESGRGREQGRHLRRRAGWGAALHVTGGYIAAHVEQGTGESVYHEGRT